jgi:hypothetical protein
MNFQPTRTGTERAVKSSDNPNNHHSKNIQCGSPEIVSRHFAQIVQQTEEKIGN